MLTTAKIIAGQSQYSLQYSLLSLDQLIYMTISHENQNLFVYSQSKNVSDSHIYNLGSDIWLLFI